MKKEITAMPVVMAGKYVPEICKTLQKRKDFIAKYKDTRRQLKSLSNMKDSSAFFLSKDSANRLWFYVIDLNKDDLVYLMHLNPIRTQFKTPAPKEFGRFSMYQGSVWRAPGANLILGPYFAPQVFWSLFRNRNWFSDSIQSEAGKAFWENRLSEAFIKGYSVYAVHFVEQGQSLHIDKVVPLTRDSDIQQYWTYEVTKDLEGMNWRFAIVHP